MPKVIVVRGGGRGKEQEQAREKMVKDGLDGLKINVSALQNKVLIKPNLITNRPYPVTTSPEMVESIINYFIGHIGESKSGEIIIAEGSGRCKGGTFKAFSDLGYLELAKKYGV